MGEQRCPAAESPEARAIVERLCQLEELVADQVIGHSSAHDCFCGAGGFWSNDWYGANNFRNDLTCIEFIEQAVRDAIVRVLEQAERPWTHYGLDHDQWLDIPHWERAELEAAWRAAA